MVKKVIFLISIILLIAVQGSFSFSQETKKQFIHRGLLRAQATISPGFMMREFSSTISLHGGLEYYLADNISFRGDSYYFLKGEGLLGGYGPLAYNHSIFSGASYHFKTKNHFDPYLYLEPGISLTRTSFIFTDDLGNIYSPHGASSVNPLISAGIGFNFYFQKWFHLFGETRYISGKYLANVPPSLLLSLSELRFSFGLGFNLSIFKRKLPPVTPQ